MQIKQIEYFLETAKTGSIGKAAQKLYISQQALSAALAAFERELGYAVFYRSKLGVTLTPQGEALLEEAHMVLQIVQGWCAINTSIDATVSDVHVAAPTVICNAIMPDVILACRQLYPHITIHLYEARGHNLFDYINEKNDFIIIVGYPQQEQSQVELMVHQYKLTAKFLYEDNVFVYINSQSPLSAQKNIKLKELQNFTLATYPESIALPYLGLQHKFAIEQPYRVTHQENLFSLIAKDSSIATTLPGLARYNNYYLDSGKVCFRPLSGGNFPFMFYLFHSSVPTESVHIIVQLLKQQISGK